MKRHTLESFSFDGRIAVSPSGCHEWQLGKTQSGYGKLKFSGKDIHAHRLAWLKFRGPIPSGMWVLHHCDNKGCVNPEHLFLGDAAANVHDMISKGRHTHGDDHWTRKHPEKLTCGDNHPLRKNPHLAARGSRHGRFGNPHGTARGESQGSSKLNDESVRDIRRRAAAGELQAKIAEIYCVRPGHIWKIVERWNWKHVE